MVQLVEIDRNDRYTGFHRCLNFFYFWASWCPACHYSSPFVDSLKRVYQGKIDFVAFNMGEHPQSKAGFLKKYKLSFPGYSIDQSNQDKLHVSALPSYMLLDKEGFVITRKLNPRLMDSLVSGIKIQQR